MLTRFLDIHDWNSTSNVFFLQWADSIFLDTRIEMRFAPPRIGIATTCKLKVDAHLGSLVQVLEICLGSMNTAFAAGLITFGHYVAS